jgi:hypothetical protein
MDSSPTVSVHTPVVSVLELQKGFELKPQSFQSLWSTLSDSHNGNIFTLVIIPETTKEIEVINQNSKIFYYLINYLFIYLIFFSV